MKINFEQDGTINLELIKQYFNYNEFDLTINEKLIEINLIDWIVTRKRKNWTSLLVNIKNPSYYLRIWNKELIDKGYFFYNIFNSISPKVSKLYTVGKQSFFFEETVWTANFWSKLSLWKKIVLKSQFLQIKRLCQNLFKNQYESVSNVKDYTEEDLF